MFAPDHPGIRVIQQVEGEPKPFSPIQSASSEIESGAVWVRGRSAGELGHPGPGGIRGYGGYGLLLAGVVGRHGKTVGVLRNLVNKNLKTKA